MPAPSRRRVLHAAGAAGALAAAGGAAVRSAHAEEKPMMKRIKMATIGAPDLAALEPLYEEWLGYKTIERDTLPDRLAESWGAPNSAGRPYIVMQPESGADVFIRAVEIDPVPGYKANTTWGWNAIEIICDDPDAMHEKLKGSPFTVIGEPKGLTNYPSIRAMQVQGPAEEVLYLTAETGDRANSLLPLPGADVGRIFIMVVAGPDIQALQDWYADGFKMARGPIRETSVALINRAQGIPLDTTRPLTTLRLAEHGNILELDGYGPHTGPRAHADGQLPPGVAMTSVEVQDFHDFFHLDFITPPVRAYGTRSITAIGPAGELLELVESG